MCPRGQPHHQHTAILGVDDGQFRQRSALIKEACTSATHPSTLLHGGLRSAPACSQQDPAPMHACILPRPEADMAWPACRLALIRLYAVAPQTCHPVLAVAAAPAVSTPLVYLPPAGRQTLRSFTHALGRFGSHSARIVGGRDATPAGTFGTCYWATRDPGQKSMLLDTCTIALHAAHSN